MQFRPDIQFEQVGGATQKEVRQVWESRHNVKEIPIKSNKDTKLFIYDTHTRKHITFDLVPNSLSDSYKPTFHTENGIYGRTTPLYFYTGGGAKTLSFSFTLHEDLLPENETIDTNKNIYKFLQVMQEFMEPTVMNEGTQTQTLVPPKVYMQVGNQFAGKGLVEITWNYQTPYRNDRYVLVELTLTFTYELEYETPDVRLFDTGDEVYSNDFTFNMDTTVFDTRHDTTLTDLLPKYMDYDYIRTYVYEERKLDNMTQYETIDLTQQFEVGIQTQLTQAENQKRVEIYVKDFDAALDKEVDTKFYLATLQSYYKDLVAIVRPGISAQDRITALALLNNKVKQLNKSYNLTGGKVEYVYSMGESGYGTTTSRMTKQDKELFETDIEKLLLMIATQQTVLLHSVGGSR